jgi:pyruvate dehydrogenase E2 component (dihydrolipoamide acetyltransferase)
MLVDAMTEFVMPKLGADMAAGTLVAWRKKPGDAVKRGDIAAEVETDKGVIEVEIFADGIIETLLVEPGAEVPVGTAMATIREEGVPAEATAAPPPTPPVAVVPPTGPGAPVASVPSPTEPVAVRQRVSPAAREMARTLGIDAATIHGSGPGGAVTREDVERAGAFGAAEPVAEPDRTARMRQVIAAAMSRSKREIPHYYLTTNIDLHAAMTWLAARNADRPVAERLLPGALFLKAVALALHEVPELNAVWTGDRAVPSQTVHVGVAISLRHGGLVAPAIHSADRKTLAELMRDLSDLVARARAGTLRSSELSEPTITVTSLGEQGAEAVFGVIYPPQVAIVGFGKVVERPWVVGGQVVPRRVVTATLSADHRASDGHRGGLFLAAVDHLLQEPQKL